MISPEKKDETEMKLDFAFDAFIAANLGKPYTTNLMNLWLQRANPFMVNLTFLQDEHTDHGECDLPEWHCSQLVLVSYWEMGIVPPTLDIHSSAITPGDLFDEDFVTNPGYSLSKPELIYSGDK